MKICVLGAGGGVGTGAVMDLIESPNVSHVIACDIRIDDMKAYFAKRGIDPKLSFREVDIHDQRILVKEISGCDVVIHCAGPFYKTAVPVARAAIEAGVNYCDVCDDIEGTTGLLGLDEEARASGRTLVTGFGVDPGVVNLLVKYAADRLDQVDTVLTAYLLPPVLGVGGDAVKSHMEHIEEGDVPQFLNGELVYVPAGSGSEFVELPEPFGRCEIHYVGHPETLTLPRYLKNVEDVKTMCGSVEHIEPGNAAVIVEVAGQIDGRAECYKYVSMSTWSSFSGEVYYQKRIGCPPSIGAQMIGSGRINVSGAFSVEECVEPEPFFEELRKRDILNWQETIIRRL